MKQASLFLLIYAAGITYVVVLGFQERVWVDAFKNINETLSPGYSLTSHNEWVGAADSLLRTGTFNYNQRGVYIGQARKDPVYPAILAASFRIAGGYVWVLYLVNFLFLSAAIFLTWKTASHVLPGNWALLPTAFIAVYPGAVSQVWVPNAEAVSLTTFLFFIASFFVYRDAPRALSLILFASTYALSILLKPILLYTLPLFFLYVIVFCRKRLFGKIFATHILLFCMTVGLIVGGWMLRNYHVFGSWQIGDGGHSLLRRASQVNFTKEEIISAALSFSIGDLIGERVYAPFPRGNSPMYWDPIIEQKWYLKYLAGEEIEHHVYVINGERVTRIDIDRRLYNEAIHLMRAHPVKFLSTSILGFLRLNAPVAYNGQEFMRFLTGRESLPLAFRIIAILVVRLFWYLFIILAFVGISKRVHDWQFWGVLILFLVSVNIFYGMFTHAEARYLLPIIPLYAIAATEVVRVWLTAK